MKLLFFDETQDVKFTDYLGITCVIIDSTHYPIIKNNFQKILIDNKWDISQEFKGSCLFSISKGDRKISIDNRITIASDILRLNKSKANSRIKFYFVKAKSENAKDTYLKIIPLLLDKILPKPEKKSGKNLITLNFDHRGDISVSEFREVSLKILKKKEYLLFEDIRKAESNFETVGILYADLFGYLKGRVDVISNDSELFNNISEEDLKTNGKVLKLKSSKELMGLIKEFKSFELKDKKK